MESEESRANNKLHVDAFVSVYRQPLLLLLFLLYSLLAKRSLVLESASLDSGSSVGWLAGLPLPRLYSLRSILLLPFSLSCSCSSWTSFSSLWFCACTCRRVLCCRRRRLCWRSAPRRPVELSVADTVTTAVRRSNIAAIRMIDSNV